MGLTPTKVEAPRTPLGSAVFVDQMMSDNTQEVEQDIVAMTPAIKSAPMLRVSVSSLNRHSIKPVK